MAKQVEDIFVRLNVQNAEALSGLRSSFRELSKVIAPANVNLGELRQQILDFGNTNARSEQLIKGQIEALKGLQKQVGYTTETYRELGNDVSRLEAELRGSTTTIDRQREALLSAAKASDATRTSLRSTIQSLQQLQQQVRPGSAAFDQLTRDIQGATQNLTNLTETTRTFAQVFATTLSGYAGATPQVINRQIATLRQGLNDLRFDSEKYLETLERIKILQITESNRSGRANVIAANRAYESGVFQGGFADPSRLPELPDTTAALTQRYSELSAQLSNVVRGSNEYVNVTVEMANIQRQLRQELVGTTNAIADQARRSRQESKAQSIRDYYNTENRDPATGAIIAGGVGPQLQNIYGMYARIVPSTQYQQPIGPQPFNTAAQAQLTQAQDKMLQLMQQYQIDRIQLEDRYNRISLEKDEAAWQKKNAQARAAMDAELADFDRRLENRERLNRRRRQPFTGLGAAQTAGAVISGGIFGGPEGFLGGLLGAAGGFLAGGGPGALGGAFAGSAFGAQIGTFRQQAAAVGDYNRELNLVKTTLAQAATSQTEYNQLLTTARRISADYSVRLKDTINAYAQITVAARANGLSLKETENIYRGLVAAGVAFGKSQQDIDAITTATVQVLSKGKISAEELSGQLGERLPGAVAKFAAATGRTLPELSKALQDGKVSIADFVKFANAQLNDYDEIAKLIGASPEKAGIRLQIALDTAAENYGGFFQKLTFYFQDNAAKLFSWLNSNQDVIKKWVTSWANAVVYVANNIRAVVNYISPAIDFLSARVKKFYDLMQANPGVAAANFLRSKLFGEIQAQAQQPFQVSDLFPEFKPPAYGSGATPPAAGLAATAAAEQDKARQKALRDAQVAADQQQQLNVELAKNRIQLAKTVYEVERDLDRKRYEAQKELQQLNAEVYLTQFTGAARESLDLAIQYSRQLEEVQNKVRVAEREYTDAVQNLNFARSMEAATAMAPAFSGAPVQEAAGWSAAQMRAFRDPNISASSPMYPIGQMVGGTTPVRQRGQAIAQTRQFISASTDVEQAVINVTAAYANLKIVQDTVAKSTPLYQALFLDKLTSKYKEQTQAIKDNSAVEQLRLKLQMQGIDPAYIQYNEDILRLEQEKARTLEGLEAGLKTGKRTQADYDKAVQAVTESTQAQAQAYKDAADAQYALTRAIKFGQDTNINAGFVTGIEQYVESIGTLRKATTDLTVNGIKGVEDAIFNLATTGTANFKQFALDIIQQTTRIIIQQFILRNILSGINNLFGGGVAGGAGSVAGAFSANAYGNAYARNGIQPFAMGGIVTKPTLFKYANGGIPGTGLMGEAGPEAIIPLRRGRDGRLGVAGGAGAVSVTVNVDAKGTNAEGNSNRSEQLGRVISQAVQAELIKQRRPGGLLT